MNHARDLTEEQRIAALKEIKLKELKRAADSEPLDMTKKARDMDEQERIEWLAAHRRRFS